MLLLLLLQLCPTLWDPVDGSPPGSCVPGILQARTLEWVAISFSNARKWKVKVKSLSRVWLFATPWTAAYQAPPSMGFSRQEYWSRVPSPSPKLQDMYIIIPLMSSFSVCVCVCVCIAYDIHCTGKTSPRWKRREGERREKKENLYRVT